MLFDSVTPAETDPLDVIDIAAVYPAELYEIAATPGVGPAMAASVHDHLHTPEDGRATA